MNDVWSMAWHGQTDCSVSFADNGASLIVEYPHDAAEIDAWRTRWTEMVWMTIPQTELTIAAL